MTKSDQVSLCDCDFVPLLSVMNYCRASFEIVTRIRQMAPLLYIVNFRKLRLRVKNETTFISAKNRVDLSSISEVRNYITGWPRYFGPPCILPQNAVKKRLGNGQQARYRVWRWRRGWQGGDFRHMVTGEVLRLQRTTESTKIPTCDLG